MIHYRYSLTREFPFADDGPVYAFIGINPSTADDHEDDATVRKWKGFVGRWGGSKFIVANIFAARSTDVNGLALMDDPVGPHNDFHIQAILNTADIIVPCWGSRKKIPNHLHERVDKVTLLVLQYGKAIKCFGKTASGDPMHPLMLGYDTTLKDW